MRARVVGVLLCASLLPCAAGAAEHSARSGDLPGLQAAVAAAALHRHPTWWRLLHYRERGAGGGQSAVVSPAFFYAAGGREDPAAELAATLAAYFTPVPEDPNAHALCRFPARYHWLERELGYPFTAPLQARCARLDRWARLGQLRSVSLILVSGYLGNPASSFGHLLLKLNNGRDVSLAGLYDQSINFGALVPQGENPLVYVWRGLFGGYEAGFSDRRFYVHDRVYSRIEQRDMWEYELRLDPFQRHLLVYHVWEQAGHKYDYYFLDGNCAYRIAELMGLVLEHDFAEADPLWYAPVDVFFTLQVLDRRTPGGLIVAVRFLPSSQRQLYAGFAVLAPSELAAANRFIRRPGSVPDEVLAPLPPGARARVADALIDYYAYRGAGEAPDSEARRALQSIRARLLRYRVALPSAPLTPVAVAPLPSPAGAPRPTRVTLDGLHASRTAQRVALGYAAYVYDLLEGSSFEAIEIEVGVEQGGEAVLRRLDLANVRKLRPSNPGIHGESRVSWRAGGGVRRRDLACSRCLGAEATGGVGAAWRLGRAWIGYVLVDGALRDQPETLAAYPNLGLVSAGRGRLSASLELGYRVTSDWRGREAHARLQASYMIGKQTAWRVFYNEDVGIEAGIGWRGYW